MPDAGFEAGHHYASMEFGDRHLVAYEVGPQFWARGAASHFRHLHLHQQSTKQAP